MLLGEKVAVRHRRVLGRKGRSVVGVRIIGDISLAWAEAAILWGGHVEVVVDHHTTFKQLLSLHYPNIRIATYRQALGIPPFDEDQGLTMATIATEKEAGIAMALICKWNPEVVVIASPTRVSRGDFKKWLPLDPSLYCGLKTTVCKHSEFGGVTTSSWRLCIATRKRSWDLTLASMTAGSYPRPLQTALDDTIGSLFKQRGSLELSHSTQSQLEGSTIYEASELAPDLSAMTKSEISQVWVRAVSVFSKAKIVRRMTMLECLAVWDYAGKIHYQGLTQHQISALLSYRLRSPPAKIVTAVVFHLAQQLHYQLLPNEALEVVPAPLIDQSGEPAGQQVAALEGRVVQRVKAAVADDAEVDLAYWAIAGESPQQAHARTVLRRFAHRWWCRHLELEAEAWLTQHGRQPADVRAVRDCIARARGSDFWEWHRGSRLFFWRFPCEDGWQVDARDGVQFWHTAPPPKGRHFLNIPT